MNIDIYKHYLEDAETYKGGKTKLEIAKEHPGELVKLSSNENLLGSSPKAIEAIAQTLSSLNEYPDGSPDRLYDALYEFYDCTIPKAQFVVGNSGSEIIEMIIRGYLGEGLECIVSTPTFMPYLIFSKKIGAKVVDIPLTEDTFDLNTEAILSAVTDKTRLVFITNPNNPTGTYLSDNTIQDLLDHLPKHIVVVIDEVYRQFATVEDYSESHVWLSKGYNVIGVNSFSKAYGLAGLRIGYLYAQPRVANYLSKLVRPFFLSMLSLNGAIAALSDTSFIQQTVDLVVSGRELLYEHLDRLGITYWKSQGNFVLIKPEMNDLVFEQEMLKQGIMVRPVGNFGAKGCIRITIGLPAHNDKLVKALKAVLG